MNVDYSKLVKTVAVEGLRVEDLVKQYFEAAEQVLYMFSHSNKIGFFFFLSTVYGDFVFIEGAALPAD